MTARATGDRQPARGTARARATQSNDAWRVVQSRRPFERRPRTAQGQRSEDPRLLIAFCNACLHLRDRIANASIAHSFVAALTAAALAPIAAQQPAREYTHADTLRGTDGPGRAWWDAEFYDLHTTVSPTDSSIRGWNAITYRVLRPSAEMQIDLQVPMEADSIVQDGRKLGYRRDGNAL